MFIIISRGLGALSLLVGLLAIPVGIGVDHATNNGRLGAAVGLAVAGGLDVALGLWLNRKRAGERIQKFAEERRADYDQLVMSGHFNLGHPWPVPTSLEMAREQADQVYNAEVHAYAGAQRDRHTLYYVPIQTWGYIMLGAALILAVLSLLG